MTLAPYPTPAALRAEMSEKIEQITAPHFCAGLVVRDGRVIEAAPIIGYMRGWGIARVQGYCAGKRWEVRRVA